MIFWQIGVKYDIRMMPRYFWQAELNVDLEDFALCHDALEGRV